MSSSIPLLALEEESRKKSLPWLFHFTPMEDASSSSQQMSLSAEASSSQQMSLTATGTTGASSEPATLVPSIDVFQNSQSLDRFHFQSPILLGQSETARFQESIELDWQYIVVQQAMLALPEFSVFRPSHEAGLDKRKRKLETFLLARGKAFFGEHSDLASGSRMSNWIVGPRWKVDDKERFQIENEIRFRREPVLPLLPEGVVDDGCFRFPKLVTSKSPPPAIGSIPTGLFPALARELHAAFIEFKDPIHAVTWKGRLHIQKDDDDDRTDEKIKNEIRITTWCFLQGVDKTVLHCIRVQPTLEAHITTKGLWSVASTIGLPMVLWTQGWTIKAIGISFHPRFSPGEKNHSSFAFYARSEMLLDSMKAFGHARPSPSTEIAESWLSTETKIHGEFYKDVGRLRVDIERMYRQLDQKEKKDKTPPTSQLQIKSGDDTELAQSTLPKISLSLMCTGMRAPNLTGARTTTPTTPTPPTLDETCEKQVQGNLATQTDVKTDVKKEIRTLEELFSDFGLPSKSTTLTGSPGTKATSLSGLGIRDEEFVQAVRLGCRQDQNCVQRVFGDGGGLYFAPYPIVAFGVDNVNRARWTRLRS